MTEQPRSVSFPTQDPRGDDSETPTPPGDSHSHSTDEDERVPLQSNGHAKLRSSIDPSRFRSPPIDNHRLRASFSDDSEDEVVPIPARERVSHADSNGSNSTPSGYESSGSALPGAHVHGHGTGSSRLEGSSNRSGSVRRSGVSMVSSGSDGSDRPRASRHRSSRNSRSSGGYGSRSSHVNMSHRKSHIGRLASEMHDGKVMFGNPTVKLAVAMEMSAALPTSIDVRKKEGCCSRLCGGRHADAIPATCGHTCYICALLSYILIIILQLMFFAHAPVPFDFWDKYLEMPPFPLIPRTWLKVTASGTLVEEMTVIMSPIPTLQQHCTRVEVSESSQSTAMDLMYFQVHLWLEAEKMRLLREHGGLHSPTVYPVLLGSSDFTDWWLIADRNHSTPQAYFRSHVPSEEYRVVTPVCNRKPEVQDGGKTALLDVDRYTTEGTYLLACIVWTADKVAWHRNNTVLMKNDLAFCDAIGGLGGKPCRYKPGFDDIEVVGRGSEIFIGTDSRHTEAVEIPGANFSGSVDLAPCETTDDPNFEKCVGSPLRFSEWQCHTCVDDEIEFVGDWPYVRPWKEPCSDAVDKENCTKTSTAPPTALVMYKSFPPFDITLRGAENVTDQPRAYVMTAPLRTDNHHHMDGPFTKIYNPHEVVRPGWPHPVAGSSPFDFEEVLINPTGVEVGLLNENTNRMQLEELNRLTIVPDSPYGPRGKFYLVACVVNRTTYEDSKQFRIGQPVRGPPFNDRCLAIAGRCAHACTGKTHTEDIPSCDWQGNIPQSILIEPIEPPFNSHFLIRALIVVLVSSFGVKLLAYVPGVFSAYPHCGKYNHVMTQMLGYIVVAVPTAGESKAVVVRNMIGAVSCMPKHCSCRYHVVLIDEGHRKHLRNTYRKFCRVLELLLLFGVSEEDDGNHVYISGAEDMLLDSAQRARSTVILKMFMKFWVEDTRKMSLKKLEAKVLQDDVVQKISGLSALKRTAKEMIIEDDAQNLDKLKKLCTALGDDMKDMKKIKDNEHEDAFEDWPGGEVLADGERVRNSEEVFFHGIDIDLGRRSSDSLPILLQLPLRVHYMARARPPEDERTIKVQEVAPGTWAYVLPEEPAWEYWPEYRRQACPYETGLEHTLSEDEYFVPLWTSRGKAGGLNFALNYMHWYAAMLDEASREDRAFMGMGRNKSIYSQSVMSTASSFAGFDHDNVLTTKQPILFSICDARHQYQPDLMHRVIPYFFKPSGTSGMFELDSQVAFVQSPQYFPEISEGLDFLDNNNAQFFRLNCMLRNCCGGVSSCGTNGTWLVPPRDNIMWVKPPRVLSAVKAQQMHEFSYFDESCKIEDTASSLKNVLHGKRSQYSNYRLSYGLAKNPTDYLAAVQRWAEGGVVLSLQTFNGDLDQPNRYLFMFLFLYVWFVAVLVRGLTTKRADIGTSYIFSLKAYIKDWDAFWVPRFKEMLAFLNSDYVEVELQIHAQNFANAMTIVASLIVMLIFIYIVTEAGGCFKRITGRWCYPTGVRWWARLAISFDNLTYFLWFWTGLFWISFNFANVFMQRTYYYDSTLMIVFAFFTQTLSWSLILAASARNSKHEMLEANEVANICVDNIWRGTQLFYMTTPLTIYSIIMGFLDYLKWRNFNQDISYWTGGDRGSTSKSLVKYWCLFIICFCLFAWIWYLAGNIDAGLSSVIIVTLIALDLIHPCAYLWLGDPQFAPEADLNRIAGYKYCREKVTDIAWWRIKLFHIICNPWGVTFVKWLGPINQCAMPFLMIALPTLGFNQAFTLLMTAGQR